MAETSLAKSPRELRDELEELIRDDLLGPIGGPEEELAQRPTDTYLLGLLAPRYVAGSLGAAQPTDADDENDDELVDFSTLPEDDLAGASATADEGEDGTAEDRPPALDQLVPSAFGLTFGIDQDCTELRIAAAWGAYTRETSEQRLDAGGRPQRVWRRRQCGGTRVVAISGSGSIDQFAPDPAEPDVFVRGIIRERGGQRLISLFLINAQEGEGRSQPLWLCQAGLSVDHPAGEAMFVRRAIDAASLIPEVDRAELAGLEMLYRNTVELAVGHGVGVEITVSPHAPDRGVLLQTQAMPAAEVPRTDAPAPDDFSDPRIREPFERALPAFDMKTLSEAEDDQLVGLLFPLADAYGAWIDAQEQRVADPAARLTGFEHKAADHIEVARRTLTRIRAGISSLADPTVAEAFRFANHAMWQQRVHTRAAEVRRRDPAKKLNAAVVAEDQPEHRTWRPFQLAFVLLNLPALADPCHLERAGDDALVDLLFFPTGGGKTEAYLGLTAVAIAIRRLQGVVGGRDGRDGVVVLMRYTLRLLTLQQFQRAAALLCACELRRRELYGRGETADQRRWGEAPMLIGLWVGQASTPNSTEDAERWVRQARQRSGGVRGASPLQLARCPWCGSELEGGRDVDVDADRGRTLITCPETSGQCPFTPRNSPGEGLPVVVVDEELYRLLPALVIATVDKFARMPWEGRTQALFGRVSRHCDRHGYLTPGEHPQGSHPKRGALPAAVVNDCQPLRPPDLIVQDELHLISGPLGSLVGLYETAIDELCSWEIDGKRSCPKVIASTATIRRAGDQVARLFHRNLQVFPPPGLDASDSFFALQRDGHDDAEQRPGRRYLGICAPGRRFKQVLIRVYLAELRAAWTVLGRQPGPAADAYMTLVGYFNSLRELGGMRRLVEDDVQTRMFGRDGMSGRGRLELEELTSRVSGADIPKVLDKLGVEHGSQEDRRQRRDGSWPVDVLLATNMISVGVDVPRLGTMIVAGQPKSTSEYIQATSRVGRTFPGLVLSVYNWSRPRDLSHYESFCHYHQTLYRQVEAFSVTPFAPRALDRGLTGVIVSLLRLGEQSWNPNPGAALIDPAQPFVTRVREVIQTRAADQIGPEAADALEQRIAAQLDDWKQQAGVGQRRLVYQRRGKSDADVSLLHEPGIEGWDRWTVPNSMRNVEPAVPLKLRDQAIPRPSEGWEPPQRSAPLPADSDGGAQP
jgi:hypothetical protein